MSVIRAVLFDFGGTLYDYRCLEPAERESLVTLLRWGGCEAETRDVQAAYREALRRVFRDYLKRHFYLHRDLFRDAAVAMAETFGVKPTEEHLERYRALQWSLHERCFTLREGARETLDELGRRGLYLGVVSNIDEDQLAHLGKLARLHEHFDSVLSSERAASCKPDAAIFEQALRSAGCAPGEAVFVGDSLDQDIAGALRAGLRSVLLWHLPGDAPGRAPKPHHVIRAIPELLGLVRS
jgi:putative hydrolase of the HAD superfamily